MSKNKSKNNKPKFELEQSLLLRAHPVIPIKILPIHESGTQLKHDNSCYYAVDETLHKEEEKPSMIKKFITFFKFKWVISLTPYS